MIRTLVLAAAALLAGASLAQEPDAPADPLADLIAVETAPDGAAEAQAGEAAPDNPPTEETALAPPPEGTARPPMWRVHDADSEIFLLGTFHILPAGLKWRTDPLIRAADLAEKIWFEAEVDTPAATQRARQILLTKGVNAGGASLRSLLGAETAARLEAITAELGLPVEQVDLMRPWHAFIALNLQFIVAQGFSPGSGVEAVLLKEARARGRELGFFETIDEQLGYFTAFDPETEKKLLTLTLRDWDQQKAEFDALFEAWRAGDVKTIDAEMNGTLRAEAPAIYETLIVARNAAWAEKLAQEMEGSGRALVAVGAGHLVGEDSLVEMLRAKGFEVERYGE